MADTCLNSFGNESFAEEGFALENQVIKEVPAEWMLSSDPTKPILMLSDS